MVKNTVLYFLVAAMCGLTIAQSAPTESGMVKKLPAESRKSFQDDQASRHVFVDKDWFNWGASVIKGQDGKYHMFYARWPKKLKFTAWLTHSEVAHAVSDHPEGPYHYVETVIKARGPGYWDQVTAHNPKIKYFDGKYYLYYISAKGSYSQEELVEIAATGYSHKEWMTLRNSQRTGVAVADKLSGPWKRLDKPIVEPAGPITKLTVNPAITRGPDGTYFMIVKGDKPGSRQRNQALATAKSPTGPFEIYPKPVIDSFDTEDASMWYDKRQQRFYAVFHAHTHIGIITSKDGYNWGKADPYTMSPKQVQFDNGETLKLQRMERPFVMLDDDGKPAMLFVSARQGNTSMNLQLPLAWPAEKNGADLAAKTVDTTALKRWQDMRFGMFIHWGPVSLTGHEIGWSRGSQTPIDEYDQLYKRFNPTKFDADKWVQVAKEAGMKYLVITSKHHDGFCLWPSEYTDYDIANTPFKRDILKELSDACKKHGILFCVYYSVCDWWHPDYPLGSPAGKSKKPKPSMDRYYAYMKNQTKELIDSYGPLGLIWFDGEWESPWTRDYGNELYTFLKQAQPTLIINNRVSKGRHGMAGTTKQSNLNAGDFDTPEQRIGGFNRERPWETCMTICQQWAWKPNDKMKSLKQCIRTLLQTAGGDGNLLFNVGPMPDGRIEPRQVERLKEMGAWLEAYGDTVYGTRGGPFKPGKWGASTCRGNKIYLFIMDWPKEGPLSLGTLSMKVSKAVARNGGSVRIEQTDSGLEVSVSPEHRNPVATVIELTVDGQAFEIQPVDVP